MNIKLIKTEQLWKVEDAFGEIKGTLKTRPMFHWTDDRIIGHLVLCFLAYLCEAHLTKALHDSYELHEKKSITNKTIKSQQLTVVQAIDELAQVMAIPVKVRKINLGSDRYPYECCKPNQMDICT